MRCRHQRAWHHSRAVEKLQIAWASSATDEAVYAQNEKHAAQNGIEADSRPKAMGIGCLINGPVSMPANGNLAVPHRPPGQANKKKPNQGGQNTRKRASHHRTKSGNDSHRIYSAGNGRSIINEIKNCNCPKEHNVQKRRRAKVRQRRRTGKGCAEERVLQQPLPPGGRH